MRPPSVHAGGMTGRDEEHVLELGGRIAAQIDPRLADVWLDLMAARPSEPIDPELAWMLRMAYLQGYDDALSEPKRGALYASLGAPSPCRPDRTRQSRLGAGARANRLRAKTEGKGGCR